MIGDDDGNGTQGMGATAQRPQRRLGVQKGIRGGTAEGADYRRLNGRDLRVEESPTGGEFLRQGDAILRRTALHHVGNVHLIPRQAKRLDNFCEELAGRADEGASLQILLHSWPLSNEHERGARIPFAENDRAAAFTQ